MPLRTLPEQAFRRRARMVAVVFCAVCLGLAARLFYLQLRTSRWYTDRALGQQLRTPSCPRTGAKFTAPTAFCWQRTAAAGRSAPRPARCQTTSSPSPPRALRTSWTSTRTACWNRSATAAPTTACSATGWTAPPPTGCGRSVRTTASLASASIRTPNGGIRRGSSSRRCWGSPMWTTPGSPGWSCSTTACSPANGVVLTAVNAWGYTLEQSYETERFPTEGDGLRLTIDTQIQHYLENALGYAVQEHHVAARAVGIVMDVNTGAVLAMSTTPPTTPTSPVSSRTKPPGTKWRAFPARRAVPPCSWPSRPSGGTRPSATSTSRAASSSSSPAPPRWMPGPSPGIPVSTAANPSRWPGHGSTAPTTSATGPRP